MPGATILPVSSALTGLRLPRCSGHERGQPTNTNRTGFRHGHTVRDVLTAHGWQSSTQGHSCDATRGSGSIIVVAVFFCTLHCALSGRRRRVRGRQNYLRVVMQKVKVGTSAAYLKIKCKLHLVHLNLKLQVLHRRTAVVPEPVTKRQLRR